MGSKYSSDRLGARSRRALRGTGRAYCVRRPGSGRRSHPCCSLTGATPCCRPNLGIPVTRLCGDRTAAGRLRQLGGEMSRGGPRPHSGRELCSCCVTEVSGMRPSECSSCPGCDIWLMCKMCNCPASSRLCQGCGPVCPGCDRCEKRGRGVRLPPPPPFFAKASAGRPECRKGFGWQAGVMAGNA